MVRHESFWLLYDNATLENWDRDRSYLLVVSLSDGWLWRHSCWTRVSRGPRRRGTAAYITAILHGSRTVVATEYQLHWCTGYHVITMVTWSHFSRSDDVDSCHLLRSATHAQCMIRIYIRQYHTRLLSYTIASSATGLPPYHCLSY